MNKIVKHFEGNNFHFEGYLNQFEQNGEQDNYQNHSTNRPEVIEKYNNILL